MNLVNKFKETTKSEKVFYDVYAKGVPRIAYNCLEINEAIKKAFSWLCIFTEKENINISLRECENTTVLRLRFKSHKVVLQSSTLLN